MTTLEDALRACAAGIHAHEAGVSLLIENRVFLGRDDFTSRFITSDTATGMAAIDWAAAITALDAGEIPCSGGEHRILQLAASIASGTPVSLSDTITGLDRHNASLAVQAIQHATGHANFKTDKHDEKLSSEKGIIRCSGSVITPASRWRGCCAAARQAATRPRTISSWQMRRSRRCRRSCGGT